MKKVFLILILVLSSIAHAADDNNAEGTEVLDLPTGKSKTSWSAGISLFQWNEQMTLQQNANTSTDVANFNALGLIATREVMFYNWGWSLGLLIGGGRANGGGNSQAISYLQSKQPFSMVGFEPRVFWRLSGRVSIGLTALIFNRSISWPSASGVTADSGHTINATAMADLYLRLFQHIDLYQAIGPLTNYGTIWQIGLAYRF
jgi:hypothetical protein